MQNQQQYLSRRVQKQLKYTAPVNSTLKLLKKYKLNALVQAVAKTRDIGKDKNYEIVFLRLLILQSHLLRKGIPHQQIVDQIYTFMQKNMKVVIDRSVKRNSQNGHNQTLLRKLMMEKNESDLCLIKSMLLQQDTQAISELIQYLYKYAGQASRKKQLSNYKQPLLKLFKQVRFKTEDQLAQTTAQAQVADDFQVDDDHENDSQNEQNQQQPMDQQENQQIQDITFDWGPMTPLPYDFQGPYEYLWDQDIFYSNEN